MGKSLKELFQTGDIKNFYAPPNESDAIPTNAKTLEKKYDVQNSKTIQVSSASPFMQLPFKAINALRKTGARTTETFLEEETTGLRAIRVVANPIIYGTDIIRLTTKSTPMLERMKESRAGIGTDPTLSKQNTGGLTGLGQRIQNIETRINNQLLGIHNPLNPTEYYKQFEGDPIYLRDDKIEDIKKKYTDTGLSKLFANARGNPQTAATQVLGNTVNAAKAALTKAVLGKNNPLTDNIFPNPDNKGIIRKRQNYSQLESEKYGKTNYEIDNSDTSLKQVYEVGKNGLTKDKIPYNVRPFENPFAFNSFPADLSIKDGIGKINSKNTYQTTKKKTIYGSLDNTLEIKRGLGTNRDVLNQLGRLKEGQLNSVKYSNDSLEKVDLIPLRFQKMNDKSAIYMRAVITGFSETYTPGWEPSKFLGSPFNFYTYTGVERELAFTLKVYAMSQIELAMMWNRLEYLAKLAYPHQYIGAYGVEPSLFYFTLGSMYVDKPAIIKSLTYTIEDTEQLWEIGGDSAKIAKVKNSNKPSYEESFRDTLKVGEKMDSQATITTSKIEYKTTQADPLLGNIGRAAAVTSVSVDTAQKIGEDENSIYYYDVDGLDMTQYKLPKFITAQIGITFLESKNNTKNNLYGYGKTITATA